MLVLTRHGVCSDLTPKNVLLDLQPDDPRGFIAKVSTHLHLLPDAWPVCLCLCVRLQPGMPLSLECHACQAIILPLQMGCCRGLGCGHSPVASGLWCAADFRFWIVTHVRERPHSNEDGGHGVLRCP